MEGHPGFAETIQELLVVDMGVIGEYVSGDERKVSICAKDSTGPYDYDMRKKLTLLAEQHDIPYETAIYPYYGSDGSAAVPGRERFQSCFDRPRCFSLSRSGKNT